MSSPVAGAEMITFFTGPRRCFLASSAFVKRPVDSTTICAPTLSHGISPGSFSLKTLNFLPSTEIESPSARTSCFRFPRMESYFSRCASVLGSVRSLTATRSKFLSSRAVRRILRPMRPNPLMPTFTAIVPPRGIQAAQKACDADGKLKIVPLHDSAAQILADDDEPRASVIQTQHAQMDAGPSPQKEKPAH